MMRLDLRLLEVFCRVYEERSFSKAARRLLLTQPTVSGHIKNLEDLLEVRLFDRLPRRIQPTGEARLLYGHGRAILERRDLAVQELRDFLRRFEGWLNLRASTIPGEYLLPGLIAAFQKKYPGVRVQVDINDSGKVCRAVARGRAELGFVGARFEGPQLRFDPLMSDEMALVAPNCPPWDQVDAMTLDELKSHPFVLREEGSGTRRAFQEKLGCDLDDLEIAAVLSSNNAVKQALKAGLGISVLSLLAVGPEIRDGALKVVKLRGFESFEREVMAVSNPSLSLSLIARTFLDFCLEQAQLPVRQ